MESLRAKEISPFLLSGRGGKGALWEIEAVLGVLLSVVLSAALGAVLSVALLGAAELGTELYSVESARLAGAAVNTSPPLAKRCKCWSRS